MSEWTLSGLHQKSYGYHFNAVKPSVDRCCVSVHDRYGPHQCQRKRGFGSEQAYCKQHSPEAVAERDAERRARYAEETERDLIPWAAYRLFDALCKIADGDNDPRATAEEAIKGLKRTHNKGE